MIFSYRGTGVGAPVELSARRVVGEMVVVHMRASGHDDAGYVHEACDFVLTDKEWAGLVQEIVAESARHARIEMQRRIDAAKGPA